jgi:hypothetical protein
VHGAGGTAQQIVAPLVLYALEHRIVNVKAMDGGWVESTSEWDVGATSAVVGA